MIFVEKWVNDMYNCVWVKVSEGGVSDVGAGILLGVFKW